MEQRFFHTCMFYFKAVYPESKIPAELSRKYELQIIPLHKLAYKPKSLRDITAMDIGLK